MSLTTFDVLSDADWRCRIDERDALLREADALHRAGKLFSAQRARLLADNLTVDLAKKDHERHWLIHRRGVA